LNSSKPIIRWAFLLPGIKASRIFISSVALPPPSNGILLSPHVDALFDEQLITFENDGRMLVHPSLPLDVLERWSIDPHQSAEAFRPEQEVFLNHHRGLFARKVR